MTRAHLYQRKLTDIGISGSNCIKNIEAVGDTLLPKQDSILRIAFQNIHGTTDLRGYAVPSEVEAIEELEIDIMGMAETNRPWSSQQKALYDAYMTKRFRASKTLYTAAPAIGHDTQYQPGGNLLSANGEITTRINGSGADMMGRFCWYTLQGRRDEGVLVIVAYRVCQDKGNNPGPTTSYQQQYVALREAGVHDPNPRKQILTDLRLLIQDKREKGYRPILLIDANGDYSSGKDSGLKNFLVDTGLSDPYHDRFPETTRTYIHGTTRIDYIFMDPALTHSIQRIGYLGTHEGAISDHVMAYVDMDHRQMFAGVVNRPPMAHSREILIEQEDKVQAFLRTLQPVLTEHNIESRVFKLARSFAEHKTTKENQIAYNKIYGEFLEIVRGVASSVGRKKFGYMRSTTLITAGSHFLAMRYLLDCKRRGAPPTKALLRLGERLSLDIHSLLELSEREIRLQMRQSRKNLWECQKKSDSLRSDWLENEARMRATAVGDMDWEKRLRKMRSQITKSAVNRKLTAITKGQRGALKMIQIPTHDWFYSESQRELYHYNSGVFDAFPEAMAAQFFTHSSRKVLPEDIQAVIVDKDSTGKYWNIMNIVPMPCPLWREITAADEIETHLLLRNQMHLEQTDREKGVSTAPPLTNLRESHGFNDLSSRILNGEEITEYNLTSEMAAFFKALRRTETDRSLPPVGGVITSADFQEMFRRAKERTASDHRTLNYTIWKCIAKSAKISGFMSVLMSLPFVYGFTNEHWTHMTDFMLEKKPGMRQIHTLRIIGKVAAEFNTCLKFLIGKKARDNFECSETCDEQHGFRPNRSAPDAMMIKLLTFESARMQKCTIGSLQHDMTAHFDRMYPEMTSIYASKYSVDDGIMRSVGQTIARLRRNVETALGVSEKSYGQETGAHRIGGMVQGKADVPQLSTQQSDVMLRAHKSLTYGVKIHSPGMHRSIQHHSVAFADDTDGQVASETVENLSIPRMVRRLQHSGQTWNNLSNICGGAIAHHKCFWQMLFWENDAGHLRPAKAMKEQLILLDGKGAHSVIQYIPPDKPNVGLGFNLCLDGNQLPHFQATLKKIQILCHSAAASHLSEGETLQLLRQRLIPKLGYALHGTSLTQKQCTTIDRCIRPVFLPRLRLNRNYPLPLVHGPLDFGGMELPDTHTLQDQVQLKYLIKQLRWDKTVATYFLVALDSAQLCSGLTTPLLENTEKDICYLSSSYIIDVRARLHMIGATLWIEKAWTPALQRVGDRSLMEAFISIPGISRAALRQANTVRLYLRVVTLADLTDVNGKYIPADTLDGEWQAGSDLKWPFQPKPPSKFWRVFRYCIKIAFCKRITGYVRAQHSMQLDDELGRWLPVKRNTWFTVYRTRDALIWRKDEDTTLQAMTKSAAPGCYQFSHYSDGVPLNSHPIKCQRMDETLWTQRPFLLGTTRQLRTPPGHVVHHMSRDASDAVTLGSDGSLYRHQRVATCAWALYVADGCLLKACYALEAMTSLSSYRSELEGMYRGLVQVSHLDWRPKYIFQGCDNKAAINITNQGLNTPSDMLAPDADAILAIRHVRNTLEESAEIVCQHIYGHQDSRGDRGQPKEPHEGGGRPRTSGKRDKALSLPAQINVQCDKLATETAQAVLKPGHPTILPPVISLPYPGSRALLRIDKRWITADLDRSILHAHWVNKTRVYCCKKYGWNGETFDIVDWDLIRAVRTKMGHTQRMQTSKIMHGWLPVMHMQAHITGRTQCPGCLCPDETTDHIFHCTNRVLVHKREELLLNLRKKWLAAGIPRVITDALYNLLFAYLKRKAPPSHPHPEIARAIAAQIRIGIELIPRGFLAQEWTTLLESFSIGRTEGKMMKVLNSLWLDFTDQVWRARNDIAHKKESLSRQAEDETWKTQLEWFLTHPQHISPNDQWLLNFTSDGILQMTGYVRKRLVKNLERVRRVYTNEQTLRSKGQQVITRFFSRVQIGE